MERKVIHTPGPWRAIEQKGQSQGSYDIGREIDKGHGPLLTFIHVLGPNDIAPTEYVEAVEANAALIAAAPDLYRELKRLEWQEVDPDPYPCYEQCLVCGATRKDDKGEHRDGCSLHAAIVKVEIAQ